MSSYKPVSTEYDIGDAISEAFGEFQALRDEMRETADNMEAGNMGHMEKCQRASEAADTLDGFADNEPDVPDAAEGLRAKVTVMRQTRKGRGESRSVRCSNAVAMLQGVVDALEEKIDELEFEIGSLENTVIEEIDAADECNADAEERRTANPPDEEEAGRLSDEASYHSDAAADAENEKSQAEDAKGELEELKEELESAISESEGVDFPGMYG